MNVNEAIKSLEEQIANSINNSGLPISIVRLVIVEIMYNLQALELQAQKQTQNGTEGITNQNGGDTNGMQQG